MKVEIDGVIYVPKNEIPVEFAVNFLLENLIKEVVHEIEDSTECAKNYYEGFDADLTASRIEAEGAYRGLKHLLQSIRHIRGIEPYLTKEE